MKLKWQATIISLLLSVAGFGQNMLMNYSLQTLPQVGVLVANVTGTSNKARVTKDTLGSLYNRFTAISAQNWTGSSGAYELFRDAGLYSHVVIDCGFGNSDPTQWITNSTGFNLTELATMVNEFFSDYPEYDGGVLVQDNEEMNKDYHSGNLKQYLAIAAVLQPICKANHTKLASGGFGDFFAINGYVFRWIKDNYGQSAANTFATYVFLGGTSSHQYDVSNESVSDPALEARINGVDTIVSSNYFDVLNFHFYNPPPNKVSTWDTSTYAYQNEVWRYYKECFANANPNHRREVACNETGQRGNSNASLVTNMLNMSWRLRFLVFDWWSGNGTSLSAEPLTQDNGTNKSNGQAYNTFNARYTGRPLP